MNDPVAYYKVYNEQYCENKDGVSGRIGLRSAAIQKILNQLKSGIP